MLATVTGLQGGAHNGLGKGFGGLLGGFTIEYTKSTHKAFRLFGFSCAAISILYIFIAIFLMIKNRKSRPNRNGDGQEDKEHKDTPQDVIHEAEKLLQNNAIEAEERKEPIGEEEEEVKD